MTEELKPQTDVPVETNEATSASEGTDTVVSETKFMIDFIARHPNSVLGGDGFYFKPVTDDPRSELAKIIDEIMDAGFIINDFDSVKVSEVLVGRNEALSKDSNFRIGGSLKTPDANTLSKIDSAFMMGNGEAFLQIVEKDVFMKNRDEVLAILWKRNVKAGIVSDFFDAISESKYENGKAPSVKVAESVKPTEPIDSKLEPVAKITKDRKIKGAEGTAKVDMKRYECTFPEIKNDGSGETVLIRKTKAVPGLEGVTIDGRRVAPRKAVDIDLTKFAGEGTSLKTLEDGTQVIVSTMSGYVCLDMVAKKISVTEHPINAEDIGPRTGSLDLSVSFFEQKGSVLREYELSCNGVKVSSGEISGTVISKEGNVEILGRIEEGGRVIAESGNVNCSGKALGGRIEAFNGTVTLKYAENCVIVGKNVVIETAVNCLVIGDNVKVTKSMGTSVFAKNTELDVLDLSQESHGEAMLLTFVYDDFYARKGMKALASYEKLITSNISSITAEMNEIRNVVKEKGLEDMRLPILEKIKKKEALTPVETSIYRTLRELHEIYSKQKAEKERLESLLAEMKIGAESHNDALVELENELGNTIGLSIGKILMPTGYSNGLITRIYRGHDLPKSVSEMSGIPLRNRGFFVHYASRVLMGDIFNESRIIPFPFKGTSANFKYDSFKKAIETALSGNISEDEYSHAGNHAEGIEKRQGLRVEAYGEIEAKEILSDTETLRKISENEPSEEIHSARIDGNYGGLVSDLSMEGIGLFIPTEQKIPPNFDVLEEIEVEIRIDGFPKLRRFVVIKHVSEKDGFVKIGGYFAHQTQSEKDEIFKMRNYLEVETKKKINVKTSLTKQ